LRKIRTTAWGVDWYGTAHMFVQLRRKSEGEKERKRNNRGSSIVSFVCLVCLVCLLTGHKGSGVAHGGGVGEDACTEQETISPKRRMAWVGSMAH